ncbi:hypothetical protein C8F04DRAFT_1263250 [Mycena alexandri]|uniref:Uncharacterized protein n=1 Tax=Mycena alexandri TaxID=1745969 RepID=A0AAD6SNS5_9AGAR|nr:hypothetical protein C8F04DRAFT_1263250 [Mycena alexandri]
MMDEIPPVIRFFEMGLGMGPHDALFLHMDARELLVFSQTCHRIYYLVKQTSFSLPRLLSPFFGHATEVDRFRRMQLQSGTLISGSIALQFFNRLKWPGSDLDLYGHRPTANLAPRKSQNQDVCAQLVASVAEKPPSYLGRGIADVLDFHKAGKKIQLIIATSTPMEVIISFHSTCVQNVISHEKAYALYPCLGNPDVPVIHATRVRVKMMDAGVTGTSGAIPLILETAGVGQEVGRQKYVDRGWRMIELPDVRDAELADHTRWVGDRFTWTICLPPLLIAVPDLCGINSWELECTLGSVAMRWSVVESAQLKYKYTVSDTSLAELGEVWEHVASSALAPVDTELAEAVIRRRRPY